MHVQSETPSSHISGAPAEVTIGGVDGGDGGRDGGDGGDGGVGDVGDSGGVEGGREGEQMFICVQYTHILPSGVRSLVRHQGPSPPSGLRQ